MSVQTMPMAGVATRDLTVARWLGYFMLVDLLFLPYFQTLIMPFSLPVVVVALLWMRVPLRDDRYLLMFGIMAFAVFVSVGIALFTPALKEYQAENLKRALQLLSSFAYFFYFRWLARETQFRAERVCGWFLLWFGLLAIGFYLDPARTGEAMRTFYGRTVTDEDILSLHLRFGYQFTDPNTAAYFMLIAGGMLLMVRSTTMSLALLTGVLVLLTFITQSKGALLALALMVLATLYPPGTMLKAIVSLRSLLLLLLLVGAGYAAFVWLGDIFRSNKILLLAYERIFESSEQIASGGSRFEIWSVFLDNFTPLPFGRGFILLIDAESYRPHSDLVRMLFSYGYVAAIPTVIWFFGRIASWPALMIPALMAFLVNSLIDEQKMLALFLALLAIRIGNEERRAHAV